MRPQLTDSSPATPSLASPELFTDAALSELPNVTNLESNHFLASIASQSNCEAAARRLQLDADERAVREVLEADRLEDRERELRRREDEAFVRMMQRRESEEEEVRMREAEEAARRFEEEELRAANGVLRCEVCYEEHWRGELMVQCPEVRSPLLG